LSSPTFAEQWWTARVLDGRCVMKLDERGIESATEMYRAWAESGDYGREAAEAVVTAYLTEAQGSCRWSGIDVGDGAFAWIAACDAVHLIPSVRPGSAGHQYCHGCGKPIEVVLRSIQSGGA
jgi:hypothetical protein